MRVVLRHQRLDDGEAGAIASSRASRDLRQQLKGPLGSTKIGETQADIGGHHADQRHVRKIMPLGDHLRADQHVELAARKTVQGMSTRLPLRRTESRSMRASLGLRKVRSNLRLDALSAKADTLEIRRRAFGARARHGLRKVAVVAARPPVVAPGVNGQRHAAVRTLERRSTLAADDRGGKTAAIQENQRLFPAHESIGQSVAQGSAQYHFATFCGHLIAHVDDLHVGHRPIQHALIERHQRIAIRCWHWRRTRAPASLSQARRGRRRTSHA